jgi:cell division protein FtsL
MATLANFFDWFAGSKAQDGVFRPAREKDDPYALRSIPNEDIYFYVKEINNARVVRESDPQARTACWKLIASAGVAAVLLIGVLLPSAYGLLAGYQIESLKQEQSRLNTERSRLELEEAKLLSPARLEELARTQQFVDPPPQKVVYLDGKGSLALNVK